MIHCLKNFLLIASVLVNFNCKAMDALENSPQANNTESQHCLPQTPLFHLLDLQIIDSGKILPTELQNLMVQVDALDEKMNSLKVEITNNILDKMRPLLDSTIHTDSPRVAYTTIQPLKKRTREIRNSCEKIIKSLGTIPATQELKKSLSHLRNRLLAREVFYSRLIGVTHRVYRSTEMAMQKGLVFPPPGGYLREDAVKAWNPGFWSSGCMDALLRFYKEDHKDTSVLTPDHALDFYTWGDDQINHSRTKVEGASTRERFIKTKCKYQDPQANERVSTGALKIVFSTDGMAYSPRSELRGEGEQICKTLIFRNGSYKRYVYPLKDTPKDVKLIYNVNENGELYVDIERLGGHVNILKGEPLRGAGVMKFKDGKISLINNDSGHYMPKPIDTIKVCQSLKAKYGPHIFHDDLEVQEYSPEEGMVSVDKRRCTDS